MDKIYEAAICSSWTTKGMEIHDVNCVSTLGSICMKAFSKLYHRWVSGQSAIVSGSRKNRDQSLGVLNKQNLVGQRKSNRYL